MEIENKQIETTRQERRAEKLRKKRGKMPQHGKSLGRIYRDAVTKRLREAQKKKNK